MMIWSVWGYEDNIKLPDLLIAANSFDEAIREARKKSPNYDAGQVTEGKHEIHGK